jgi:hypothetical protein
VLVLARALIGDWKTSAISATRQILERRKLNNFLIPCGPQYRQEEIRC